MVKSRETHFQAFSFDTAFHLQDQLNKFQEIRYVPSYLAGHTIYANHYSQNIIQEIYIVSSREVLVRFEQAFFPKD